VLFVSVVCMYSCHQWPSDYPNMSTHNCHKLLTRNFVCHGHSLTTWMLACYMRHSMCNWITQPHIWGPVRDQTLLQGPPWANPAWKVLSSNGDGPCLSKPGRCQIHGAAKAHYQLMWTHKASPQTSPPTASKPPVTLSAAQSWCWLSMCNNLQALSYLATKCFL